MKNDANQPEKQKCGNVGKFVYFCSIIHLFMTKEEKVAYWRDLADYDIETAEGLFVVKRWLS